MKDEKTKFKSDCIHLKACRRMQSIAKHFGYKLPRYCTDDCTAYISGESDYNYVTTGEAVEYARRGAREIMSGYDEYDVYSSVDLIGKTLGEIVNEEEENVV